MYESFGRTVHVAAWIGILAGDRTDVHDAAALSPNHSRHDRVGHVYQPRAVGGDHAIPVIEIRLVCRCKSECAASVVDENVDARELLGQVLNRTCDGGAICDIELQRKHAILKSARENL